MGIDVFVTGVTGGDDRSFNLSLIGDQYVGFEGLLLGTSNLDLLTGERAIEAGDADMVTITNSGTIEASERAINLGDDLTIVNNGTISNEGFDTKIIDAGDGLTITNTGLIRGGENDALELGPGTITNSGIIRGEGDDTAILAGILDSDSFSAFETFRLGSQLGGTLNDLTI